jgi:hypothetical protein
VAQTPGRIVFQGFPRRQYGRRVLDEHCGPDRGFARASKERRARQAREVARRAKSAPGEAEAERTGPNRNRRAVEGSHVSFTDIWTRVRRPPASHQAKRSMARRDKIRAWRGRRCVHAPAE